MKNLLLLIVFMSIIAACTDDVDSSSFPGLAWTWIDDGQKEQAVERLIYEEQFGEENALRLNQSMSVWQDNAFCFIHGSECKVLNFNTKEWLQSDPLPEQSHNNNAQFLNTYYDSEDNYPLLLLSRGDYPPNQNDAYIVRVKEDNQHFYFSIVKTIHNTIQEARYNGSWIIDEEHKKIYLYCMTKGDWRLKENNNFIVFSFPLPDILESSDISLGYNDVLDRWEYPYLIHQGGTYYNGYLFFNVQSMKSYEGRKIGTSKDVIVVNTVNGRIEAIMPLTERKETEGICIYNNKLYISFKNGNSEQNAMDIVFTINEYTLPASIVKRKI